MRRTLTASALAALLALGAVACDEPADVEDGLEDDVNDGVEEELDEDLDDDLEDDEDL